MPKRIQMSRQRPWRAENPDAVIVDRTTVWGNPYRLEGSRTALEAVTLYQREILGNPAMQYEIVARLSGSDLACWCPLDQPCHADVLLEIANPEENHPHA